MGQIKTLKFVPHLADLIISGKKTTTWRFFDEKEIHEGDDFIFINKKTGKEFATAKIVSVKEKSFCDVDDEDRQGHEKFESTEEMYKTYRRYYGDRITASTKVKIVKFKIVEFL